MINNNTYDEATQLLNAEIRSWTTVTQNALKNNIRMMSTKGKGDLLRMTHEYFRHYGQIDRISFRFPKHGVFFAKGVSRGYRSKNGKVYKVDPSRTHGFNRQPKDWFNSTLEDKIPVLADRIGEIMANAAVNATNAKIR